MWIIIIIWLCAIIVVAPITLAILKYSKVNEDEKLTEVFVVNEVVYVWQGDILCSFMPTYDSLDKLKEHWPNSTYRICWLPEKSFHYQTQLKTNG